ncbi:MAG: MBL fold metallo-hydrolase [Proteobacteria bacterium]|nr:MBL fold metallo-hydrolase [Pseudomonadota bacterium]MBI3496102.1 MBL fold metallo-hydrolase [Pseudomonadota bacterium]
MFEIHSLRLGELFIPQGGGIVREPIHTWYATNGKVRLLVDTGMPDPPEVKRRLNIESEGGGHDALRRALGTVDAKPEQIDIIIVTHLHFDHAWNLDLFPQACVVLQRDEMFHAIDPAATQRIFYLKETVIGLLNRKRPSQLRLVDGDLELMDGVQLLKVPGHTFGMHIPVITTKKGRAAIVTDLGDHYSNWYPADPRATKKPMRFLTGTFLPPSIRSESERMTIASMQKVLDASDVIVPAHDFRIPRHMPEEWFDVPDSTEGDLKHVPPPPRAAAE